MVRQKENGEAPAAHPGLSSSRISRLLFASADYLSTARGFIATFVVLVVGIAIGVLIRFDNFYMLGFNLFLSILAIVLSGIILVSGARSEAALHVKLDYLIRYSRAKNDAIGLEHREVEEIEAEREAIEAEAAEKIEKVVEREVEEEITERLGRRKPATRRKARTAAKS